MFIKCKICCVPYNGKANDFAILKIGNSLVPCNREKHGSILFSKGIIGSPYDGTLNHLYILDPSDKITIGSWIYSVDINVRIERVIDIFDVGYNVSTLHGKTQFCPKTIVSFPSRITPRMIIATSDIRLKSPFSLAFGKMDDSAINLLPLSFIEKYCEKPVDEIFVKFNDSGEIVEFQDL